MSEIEINGLRNIVDSTSLHTMLLPPVRAEYDTDEEYEFACEVFARSQLWHASIRDLPS